MNVLGIISEYNPFHYGHQYHLKKSLSLTNSEYSVAVMSSSFVQRGEPALIDKWTRAKMAIKNGVDLVLELPFIYSSQSAELFSEGAINILNSLNIVDYLSFGSEEGDLEPLNMIADVLANESKSFKVSLGYHLSLGNSFAKSRSLAVEDELKKQSTHNSFDFKQILKQSNNILAIEYLKALSKTSSHIKPVTVMRKGSDYKDLKLNRSMSSASSIRDIILNKNLDLSKDYIPLETYNLLKEYMLKYKNFNNLENYKSLIRYKFLLQDKEKLNDLFDVDEGLENRILKFIKKYNNIEKIITNISTKRYPATRIKRIFVHLLLDLYEVDIKKAYKYKPNFIRVLASNKKGLLLLNRIKSKSDVDIITKFSNYTQYNNKTMEEFFYFEKKATDIYFLGLDLDNPLVGMDYLTSPYIKIYKS